MEKCSFYSMMEKNHNEVAVLHDGYTDGAFYYYKSGVWWAAIEPKTGRSVSFERSRKMAADVANSSQKLKALDEFKATAKYKEYCSQLEKAWKLAEFGLMEA